MRKHARFVIAVFGVVFTVFVALQFRRHGPATSAVPTIAPTAPGAIMESIAGTTQRFSSSREDAHVSYEKLLTYEKSSKMIGVTITTESRENPGRGFVVTGREGTVGQNESTIALDGDVRLKGSDGMSVSAEHATYQSSDGSVAAPGPVEFAKGRMSGKGVGLQFDKQRDMLTILDRAAVRIAPEGPNDTAGGVDVTSGSAIFARADKYLQFDRGARILRNGQTINATQALARLSADGQRVQSLELHDHPTITGGAGGPGSLRGMSGNEITLFYDEAGRALQRALVVGNANIQLAGDTNAAAGRQISAQSIDVTMAPDGSTPTSLFARDTVQLAFPPDRTTPARTIQANQMDSKGEPGRGLTNATFAGNVQFRERGPQVNRAARSAQLIVAMKPGMGDIDEARFYHDVHFEEGSLAATAANAKYDTAKGTLELTGSEPALPTPRAVNDRIAVDATQIDIVLDGPKVNASGSVKSALQPTKSTGSGSDAKLPSMLKEDQPVTVLADTLAYDGGTSLATYTGGARLFQTDTTIKGDTIVINEKLGDLSATGHAMSTTIRESEGPDKKKQRSTSTGTSTNLVYEDASRKLTYTGTAHLVGPDGDMSADRIELFLKQGADDVDRAEGYAAKDDKLTLREPTRTTTGGRLTYTSANETYLVTGLPATVVDRCGRETIGKTLTFMKSTDTIVADGNQQIRTQTKGGNNKCP